MGYQKIQVPATGDKITVNADTSLNVPNNPIIPYIEGDGIGVDISPVMIKVVDAAVEKAYGGERKISWMEVYAGEKATQVYDQDTWLPQETLDAVKDYVVSIKGPLTTPVGGGIRSLNVALRQQLDLYVCLRPVRWFEGVPSPVKKPGDVDMTIFRENSEDIYAGIEWKAGSPEANKVIKFLKEEMGVTKIRFDQECGIGVKPVSKEGTQRLARKALQYVVDNDRDSLTIVHKGNIMKFTEGAFKEWAYEIAAEEFGATLLDGGPWMQFKNPKTGKNVIVKDAIADAMLQQILLRPAEYDVIATLNLNGDYLSAEMMLRHMGWTEAADLIIKGTNGAISAKTVTYDFERLMEGAQLLSCSQFGDAMIAHMKAKSGVKKPARIKRLSRAVFLCCGVGAELNRNRLLRGWRDD